MQNRTSHSIAEVCANLARYKRLWSYTAPADHQFDVYADKARRAGDLLAALEATSFNDVLLKLSELLDLVSEVPAQADLLVSAMTDLQRLSGLCRTPDRPSPPAPVPLAPTTPQAPQPVATITKAPRKKVRIDRRARPVTVDGTLYGSIQAASKATGISYNELLTRNRP